MSYELDIGQSATLTDVAMCINHYRLFTPGLYVCVHIPVQLDPDTRIVPGVVAQVNHGVNKQCDPSDYDYFTGPPNFVFDAFKADEIDEYEFRLERFESSGVLEYVAWHNGSPLPIWNRLINRSYETIESDEDGMIMSTALPGMWIPIESLKKRDWWSIMATISRGVTRRGHHDFMDKIWNK